MKASPETLADELISLANHPRAVEIFMNEWVIWADLPLPSSEAVRFLLWLLMRDENLGQAVSAPYSAVVGRIVQSLRSWTRDEVLDEARKAWPLLSAEERMQSGSLGCRAHEWVHALESFYVLPDRADAAVRAGQRAIAARFIEALLHLAVLNYDVKAIRSLANAMERIKENRRSSPLRIDELVARILTTADQLRNAWMAEKEGELPKTAVEGFLTEFYPDEPEYSKKLWSAAWKEVGDGFRKDRTAPKDSNAWGRSLAKRMLQR